MIYFIQAVSNGSIKIGFTDLDDAYERLAQLQTGSPVPLKLLGTIAGSMEDEKDLHRRFAAHRIQGEWFRPIPELLAFIAAKDVNECGGVTITEQSVTIRVLTVGRKQLSQKLVDQLPTQDHILWCEVLDCKPAPEDLPQYLEGKIWGWITGGRQSVDMFLDEGSFPYRWVIWERDGRLRKGKEFVHPRAWLIEEGLIDPDFALDEKAKRLAHLYRSREMIVGLRPEDQLFFGV